MLMKAAPMLTKGDFDKLMRLGDCSMIKAMSDGDQSKIEASVAPRDGEAAREKCPTMLKQPIPDLERDG